MLVSTADGKTFTLTRETNTDHQLLDALDLNRHISVESIARVSDERGGQQNKSVTLCINRNSQESIRADAGREVLSALGQLIRLGLREAAQNGLVGTAPTNPQPQEQLSTCLVQLQVMVQALGEVVRKQEVVIEEMRSAHDGSSSETTILAQGATQATAATIKRSAVQAMHNRAKQQQANQTLLNSIRLLSPGQHLVGDQACVIHATLGVDTLPIGCAPNGESVRVYVYTDNPNTFSLHALATFLSIPEPLIEAAMQGVTVLEHSAQSLEMLALVPSHTDRLNLLAHEIP